MLAMHAVNLRNRADDVEAEMIERLRASITARAALLERAPVVAREMGLPAAAQDRFKSTLRELDAQFEADPASALPRAAPSVVDAAPTPAQTPAGSSKPKQAAVW